jgi:hypothetical protein
MLSKAEEKVLYEKIVNDIDQTTEPRNMNKKRAKDFLEQLQSDIESRLDGLKDEMADEDNDNDEAEE